MRFHSFLEMLSRYADTIPERTALYYGNSTRLSCTYAELKRAVLQKSAELSSGVRLASEFWLTAVLNAS